MTDNSLEEDYLVKKHNIDTTPEQFKKKPSPPEDWEQRTIDIIWKLVLSEQPSNQSVPNAIQEVKQLFLSHEQKIKSQFRKDLEKWKCPPHEKMGECVPWHAVEDALNNPGLFEK